ncbi:methyltransferase family protein [Allosalinactinospora lopnorensis]|uniref:methyltransferase family protein n=1 Tax=Allosalinactinospora lopnorensis TaxID=1352348 RepID=UPI000623FB6E|nr:isoprenylcysteine carboxylmethyltransferase family protein [Allosalinactinospora lopnorensis]
MRSKTSAAVGSIVFFLLAPGFVAGLGPWWITRWELGEPAPYWVVAQAVGVLLICAGLFWCIHAFARFAMAWGTPAPITPTRHLVVEGPNRYVRNPMYVSLLGVILGQALLFGSFDLVLWAAFFWGLTALFVRFYEEPTLLRQFGSEYETYRRNVPAWLPRLRPWRPEGAHHVRG